MSDVMNTPEFLALTLRAQKDFGKAWSMKEAVEGQHCVQDMLDMLGAEIDREKGKK